MHGTTNGSDAGNSFAEHFLATCARIDAEEHDWHQQMKDEGIAAVRPDDGWVDRERNTVHFSTPYILFKPLEAGAKVALGRPDKYRIVEITGIEVGLLGWTVYHFKET